jgi:penicillin-binding protein 1C
MAKKLKITKSKKVNSQKSKRWSPPKKTPRGTLKAKHRQPIIWFITLLALLVIISGSLYWYILKDLPSPDKLSTNPFPVSTLILDRHEQLLYEIFADQNRTPVRLNQLPDTIKQATVAIEDKNFYQHHGLSLSGIVRAIYNNFRYLFCQLTNVQCQLSYQGASTITQQLVKNTLLTPERTIQRKIKEAILTLAIEASYSKDQILEMYLNHVPYGGTAYGIESAAQTYFQKSANQLTSSESTILAGLPQAPSKYSPYSSNPDTYKKRQKTVLRRMVEDQYLTQKEADEIENTPVEFAPQANLIHAPHFVLWVKDILVERYGQQTVEQNGLRVITTLDLNLQQFVQQTVTEEISNLKNYRVTNGASLVTHPATGQILAMVGSADYFNRQIDGNVNFTLRYRQPGSSIKPLNYAMGLASGELTTSSLLADIPTCFSVTGQSLYCPVNYDGQYHGPVRVRTALSNSYNIPAVRVLAKNKILDFIATSSAMGITGWDNPSKYGLSLTLGGGDVRMIDMAIAYATLANYGNRVNLNPILKVENYKGELLEELACDTSSSLIEEKSNSPNLSSSYCNPAPIIPPEAAFLTTHILSDSSARAPAFGTNLNISNHSEIAVKTGTTNDLRDNWTIGYTPNFMVAAWVGNFDNSPMSRISSGITGAAPIWKTIMSYLVNEYQNNKKINELSPDPYPLTIIPSEWPRPESIIELPICQESGLAVSPDPNANVHCTPKNELFIKDLIPQHHTNPNRPWPIDKTTGRPAIDRTSPENIEMQNRTIFFDILGTAICLDCAPPEDPVIIKYP